MDLNQVGGPLERSMREMKEHALEAQTLKIAAVGPTGGRGGGPQSGGPLGLCVGAWSMEHEAWSIPLRSVKPVFLTSGRCASPILDPPPPPSLPHIFFLQVGRSEA